MIWELVSDVRMRLLAAVRPDGFNIGLNEGLAARQTVIHTSEHPAYLELPVVRTVKIATQ